MVHGLTAVRGTTQGDSHSYVTAEQAPGEIKHLLSFVLGLLRDFGLDDYYLELSTRDEANDKFIGTNERWEVATQVLREAAEETGLELVPDPGGAAFYGPKISVQARDAIGRTWQMSTIQYDFNQPARFGLEYQAAPTARASAGHDPLGEVRLARAVLRGAGRALRGSLPAPGSRPSRCSASPWPMSTTRTWKRLRGVCGEKGVRVEIDESDDRFPKKIRNASKAKVPFVLIAGEEDRSAGAVSFRFRSGGAEERCPGRRRHRRDRAGRRAGSRCDRGRRAAWAPARGGRGPAAGLPRARPRVRRGRGRLPAAVDAAPDGLHQGDRPTEEAGEGCPFCLAPQRSDDAEGSSSTAASTATS